LSLLQKKSKHIEGEKGKMELLLVRDK